MKKELTLRAGVWQQGYEVTLKIIDKGTAPIEKYDEDDLERANEMIKEVKNEIVEKLLELLPSRPLLAMHEIRYKDVRIYSRDLQKMVLIQTLLEIIEDWSIREIEVKEK